MNWRQRETPGIIQPSCRLKVREGRGLAQDHSGGQHGAWIDAESSGCACCSASFSAGRCLGGNPAAVTPTAPSGESGSRGQGPVCVGEPEGGGKSRQGGGSKCLLTWLQQLFSRSSLQPGQGPWHRGLSAMRSRYPRAQEGGGVPAGTHSHSHPPRLGEA